MNVLTWDIWMTGAVHVNSFIYRADNIVLFIYLLDKMLTWLLSFFMLNWIWFSYLDGTLHWKIIQQILLSFSVNMVQNRNVSSCTPTPKLRMIGVHILSFRRGGAVPPIVIMWIVRLRLSPFLWTHPCFWRKCSFMAPVMFSSGFIQKLHVQYPSSLQMYNFWLDVCVGLTQNKIISESN